MIETDSNIKYVSVRCISSLHHMMMALLTVVYPVISEIRLLILVLNVC